MKKTISIFLSLFENTRVARATVLPRKVGKWEFVRVLGDKEYPYRVGLYKYRNSNVVVKAWRGSHNSVHYFSLKREIQINKVLSKAQLKLKDNLVFVPSFVKEFDRTDGLFFITQYVEGNTLATFAPDAQVKGYLMARRYLRQMSNLLTTAEKKKIGVRQYGYFASMSVVLFPFAIIKNWTHKALFLKAWRKYVTSFVGSFTDQLQLVHGDLHPENIIKSGKLIYILDMEQAMFTYSTYEDATTVSTNKTPQAIESVIMNEMKEKGSRAFSLMLIHINIHNMIGILVAKNGQFYRGRIKKALTL